MPDTKPTVRYSATRPDAIPQEPGEQLFSVRAAIQRALLPPELRAWDRVELSRAIGRFRKARGIEPRKFVHANGHAVTAYAAETWADFAHAWAHGLLEAARG